MWFNPFIIKYINPNTETYVKIDVFIEYFDILKNMVIIVDRINITNGIYVDTLPNNIDNNIHSIVNAPYNTIFLFEYGINELENDRYIHPNIIKRTTTINIFGGTLLLNRTCLNPNTTEQIMPYMNKLLISGIFIYFMLYIKSIIPTNTKKYKLLYVNKIFCKSTVLFVLILLLLYDGELTHHITLNNNTITNIDEIISGNL